MPVNKILSSIKRTRRKKRVIREILNRPQRNEGVINIHRIDTRNIGDYYSAPHHYFKALHGTSVDIFDYKSENPEVTGNFIEKITENAVIVGGGGLLNRGGFRRQMKLFEDLSRKGKKVVLWGVGHNAKDPATFGKPIKYNVDIGVFGMAGTRDQSMPGDYVPCVSCMHGIFDQKYEPTQEIGVVFHKDTLRRPRITKKFSHLATSSNTTDLDSLIAFIGASETVITDSYHTMYWSMLLGRKVVAIPNSSKFFDFGHKPVFSDFDSCLQDVTKAYPYEGVLEECRTINREFAARAFDYLNL